MYQGIIYILWCPHQRDQFSCFQRFDALLYPQQIESKSKEKNKKHSRNYSVMQKIWKQKNDIMTRELNEFQMNVIQKYDFFLITSR